MRALNGLAGLMLLVLAHPLCSANEAERAEFFEARVRPLLVQHCHSCHRTRKEGGLRLDSRLATLAGGNSGPAIIPGDAQGSLLIQAVSRSHNRLKMPPERPLGAEEVRILARWVADGAVWPLTSQEMFRDHVRPTLEARCLECHGTKHEGGLDLTTRTSLLKGGDRGPAVVPGNPGDSLLLAAVQRKHDDLQMPPSKPLLPEEVRWIERWIRNGAPWSGPEMESPEPFSISPEQRAFWSFAPLTSPAPPVSSKAAHNAVDAFIQQRLAEQGLQQGPLADKRTLIRRLTFDLIGLPPTIEEVEAFLADDAPDAYNRLVERLLNSRHYGERWGRHWLDLVRYADTAGDASDFPIPEAYKYRNYVIEAMNADLPYDQFVREQLAGDLLPTDDEQVTWRRQIATGYLAVARRVGVSPQGQPHIIIEDVINNLGKTFLGLTIGCARCHDHKFDPIPTTDYYALYGIFASSILPHPGAEHKPYRENFAYRVGQERADELLAPYREKLAPLSRRERQKFEEYRALQRMDITKAEKGRAQLWTELEQIRAELAEVAKTFPNLEIAYAAREGKPQDVHVHKAGDPKKPGTLVRRGFLEILGGGSLPKEHAGSGRRQLAEWIVDPSNPLTARVMANRIWHHHFGRGLVATTSDFGVRGAAPTHPQLLDYLAGYFIEEGWSIKQMHRLMVSSRTYRLSSLDIPENTAVDPQNHLLWRANRQRLDAEQIRDSLLVFSDSLDRRVGHRHPFPHRLTYFFRQHEPFQESYASSLRSVYLMQPRIRKHEFLDLFDGPDGNIQFAERKQTTTSLQALYLMNSKFMHEQSDAIAARLLGLKSVDARVRWAYRTILGAGAWSG